MKRRISLAAMLLAGCTSMEPKYVRPRTTGSIARYQEGIVSSSARSRELVVGIRFTAAANLANLYTTLGVDTLEQATVAQR